MKTTFRIYGDDDRAIFNDMVEASGADNVEVLVNFPGPPEFRFWGVTVEQLEANEDFKAKREWFEKAFRCSTEIKPGWAVDEFDEVEMHIYPEDIYSGP